MKPVLNDGCLTIITTIGIPESRERHILQSRDGGGRIDGCRATRIGTRMDTNGIAKVQMIELDIVDGTAAAAVVVMVGLWLRAGAGRVIAHFGQGCRQSIATQRIRHQFL